MVREEDVGMAYNLVTWAVVSEIKNLSVDRKVNEIRIENEAFVDEDNYIDNRTIEEEFFRFKENIHVYIKHY